MGIESLNSSPAIPMDASALKSIDGEVQQIVSKVAPLFRPDSNISVGSTKRKEGDDVSGTEDVDVLDPVDQEKIDGNNIDLEALIAKLQAETDEAQLAAAKERINSLKGQMRGAHANTMKKVNESIDALLKQEKSQKLQKALGWLGIIAAGVMLALTVLTGGGAAAIAVAVIGLVLSVTTQVLNETGKMKDIVNWMADTIQKMAADLAEAVGGSSNMTREEAEAKAELIIAIVEAMIAVTMIACGGAAGAMSKGIKIAMIVAGAVMGAVGIGAGGYATYASYKAAMAQANVTEDQAILKKLQTMLEQESDALKLLLQQLTDSMGAVFELLDVKQKTLNMMLNMNINA